MIAILIRQVVIMFILMGVGMILYKTGKISNEGSKTLGNILVFLVLPCVIINGFLVEKTPERVRGLIMSIVLSLVVLLLSMLITRIVCRRHAIDNFGGSFSNPAFFGVPIIVATLSDGAVFYMAAFIAFLNLLQWTYGASLLKNSDENGYVKKKEAGQKLDFGKEVKRILLMLIKAPFMIAIIIGLFFFFTQLPMPAIAGSCIKFIKDANTPIAMFTIGVYAAQTNLGKMFLKKRLYVVSAVKLILIPIVAMLILKVLPVNNEELKICMLLAAACPVGSNIAVYAQLYDRDYKYAVETVVISTIFSIITIPLVMALSGLILG